MTALDQRPERVEIDPTEFPILAAHWPFVPPNWCPIGQVTAEIVDRLSSRHGVDDHGQDAAA